MINAHLELCCQTETDFITPKPERKSYDILDSLSTFCLPEVVLVQLFSCDVEARLLLCYNLVNYGLKI